jgi:sulfite dehydrogenase (cytochrome) subunit B
MRTFGRSIALLACVAGSPWGIHCAMAESMGPVTIQLPAETARLKSGPGLEATQSNCMTCHSVDYIYMQPPLSKDQWHGEVMKMKKVMGAPIPDDQVDTIVQYLMSQNGKK